jgi:2-polyprenyl-6-methoxyphenol hydroxylase-like FAD-dependent oxidoreductase
MASEPVRRNERAVVIGGSMAGLLCARRLSEHFREVLLLDRDELPLTSQFRAGVPQSRHVHALLAGGLQAMEQMFPNFQEALLEAGAVRISWPKDVLWLSAMGWGERFSTGIEVCSMSRELLEHEVRKRVRALGNVQILDGVDVTGLHVQAEAVVGVRLGGRTPAELMGRFEGGTIPCDLAVDATGRGSMLPRWLNELGFPTPEDTVIDAHLSYVSALYEPGPAPRNWKMMFLQARPPHAARGAAIFPVEGGRWMVTLAGYGSEVPPMDDAGFLNFADGLRTPLCRQALQEAKRLTPLVGNRSAANRLRHFERLSRWPKKLIAVGDSVCAFNPIYGQGMTVAAQGANVVHEELMRLNGGSLMDLGLRLQRKLAKNNDVAWLLATGEDARFPSTEGAKPGRVDKQLHRYLDRLLLVATRRPMVATRLIQVIHMTAPPAQLFHPALLWAAATGGGTEPLMEPPLAVPDEQTDASREAA